MLVFIVVTPVVADIFDTAKNFFSSSAVHGAITTLFAIKAVIFGADILRFKKLMIMSYEVYCEYRDANLKDSQGSEKVIREEWDTIFKKVGEAVMALLAVASASWAKRFITG